MARLTRSHSYCTTTSCLAYQQSSTERRRILKRVKVRASEACIQPPNKDFTESSQNGLQPQQPLVVPRPSGLLEC